MGDHFVCGTKSGRKSVASDESTIVTSVCGDQEAGFQDQDLGPLIISLDAGNFPHSGQHCAAQERIIGVAQCEILLN